MTNSTRNGEYAFPATAAIVIGGLATLAGMFLIIPLPLFGFLALLLGVPLLTMGLLRESREKAAARTYN